jgi:IS1 family transposase
MRPIWDTRVVFIERQQRWWWNAWHESTSTELYGFAGSREEASQAMYQAIERAGPGARAVSRSALLRR